MIRKWEEFRPFTDLWKIVQPHTFLDVQPAWMIYQLAEAASRMPHPIAEVGVCQGGTAKIIIERAPDSMIFLFDTFEGHPTPNPKYDDHKVGTMACSMDKVQKFLGLDERIIYKKGIFPASAGAEFHFIKFSFVHVDCDLYQSVKDCCEFFYDRLATGGVILFDDYSFSDCRGAQVAVDEFFKERREYPLILPTGQVMVTKL